MRTWVTTGNIKKGACYVGRKLLSERDENYLLTFDKNFKIISRKETTL